MIPDCLCQRAESEVYIYIHTERFPELESQTSSSRQYFCALRTLGCFVPLGWALLFTQILGMRQGSIQCRSHSPPPETREVLVLCPSTAEVGRIPWIGHLKRPCGYGSNEGPQSHRMADPNEGQGGPVLPWLCELLSEVYL